MKQPDTNVLLYAVNSAAPQHATAISWLRDAFTSPAGVGLSWVGLLGFVRIATHPRILQRPLAMRDALRTVNFWLDQPRVRILHPTDQHSGLLGALLSGSGGAGNLVTDAHLATLAIEHGATLASFDSDFERFEGLQFERLRA